MIVLIYVATVYQAFFFGKGPGNDEATSFLRSRCNHMKLVLGNSDMLLTEGSY